MTTNNIIIICIIAIVVFLVFYFFDDIKKFFAKSTEMSDSKKAETRKVNAASPNANTPQIIKAPSAPDEAGGELRAKVNAAGKSLNELWVGSQLNSEKIELKEDEVSINPSTATILKLSDPNKHVHLKTTDNSTLNKLTIYGLAMPDDANPGTAKILFRVYFNKDGKSFKVDVNDSLSILDEKRKLTIERSAINPKQVALSLKTALFPISLEQELTHLAIENSQAIKVKENNKTE